MTQNKQKLKKMGTVKKRPGKTNVKGSSAVSVQAMRMKFKKAISEEGDYKARINRVTELEDGAIFKLGAFGLDGTQYADEQFWYTSSNINQQLVSRFEEILDEFGDDYIGQEFYFTKTYARNGKMYITDVFSCYDD